jgi:hypothetical protein
LAATTPDGAAVPTAELYPPIAKNPVEPVITPSAEELPVRVIPEFAERSKFFPFAVPE